MSWMLLNDIFIHTWTQSPGARRQNFSITRESALYSNMWHMINFKTPTITYYHTLHLVNPHIIAHILTIHCGLPSRWQGLESSFASRYSRLRCASDFGSILQSWSGALDCALWVPGLRYVMCRWQSRPWEWWSTTLHIQTQSTADPLTMAAAKTPLHTPGSARWTFRSTALAPRDTWSCSNGR